MTLSPRDNPQPQNPLPTPTSTIASAISEEDVAMQLIRLQSDPLATPSTILSPRIQDDTPSPRTQSDLFQLAKAQVATQESEHSRCTKCIASKKGCDRKRPCGRCVAQGLDESGCFSDDERGSARKRVAQLRRSHTLMRKSFSKGRKAAPRSS